MSDQKQYVIEVDGDSGDVVSMHRLVRCKECRYAYERVDARRRWLLCRLNAYFVVKPDFSCARGETEEGE